MRRPTLCDLAQIIIITTITILPTTTAFLPISPLSPPPPPSQMPLHAKPALGLDDALTQWATTSGFGPITSSSPQGSSGWATFRRIKLSNGPDIFCKSSTRSCAEMFEGEALGLQALYECSSQTAGSGEEGLKIPKVYRCDDLPSGNGSFLLMEYLELSGRSDDHALGRAMAQLHLSPAKSTSSNPQSSFGFPVDNTIGGTPQINTFSPSNSSTKEWIAFFRDERIGYQLGLANDPYCSELWERDVAPRLGMLFEGLEVRPSLLHGDLWSGNIGSCGGGGGGGGRKRPTVYDPAVYWGHHEAEWGMDWCASLGGKFWEGYRELIEEDEGFWDRKPLYDAYHQLNHYNLFGGGYLRSARGHIETLKRTLDKRSA